MRQLTASALALALGVAAAVALVSCGGGDDAKLLPGGTAGEITENLDMVKRLASEGECVGAEDAAEQVSAQVEALGGIDETLKRALERGATRLNEVVATCEEAVTEAITPTTVPTTTESTTESEEKEKEKDEDEEEGDEEEGGPETTPTGPPEEIPPPHSNGQGKGPGGDEEPAEEPSGGIGPGDAVGEGD